MYLKRSSTVKYLLAGLCGAVLYCEWFTYYLQPTLWESLECQSYDITCTKVLFIADPQIQGDTAVPPPLSYLFNWDSDRYLSSTFSVVLNYFKPDVLVYLGDLMDEGSIATMVQFHGYVKRLSKIFDIDHPVVQVWLPGDNDIGGEGEPIKKEKVAEFEKVFQQPPVIKYKNISFYKVNGITHNYPKTDGENDENLRIVVSHYPLTKKSSIVKQVQNEIRPDIYFCAHDHISKYIKQNKDLQSKETHMFRNGILDVAFGDNILYEIYVPTCSYRMGTSDIGFGAAVIENNNHNMRYTVFWSSTRFPFLFFYLAVLIVFVVYVLVFCAAKLFFRTPKHTNSIRTSDKLPLLDKI